MKNSATKTPGQLLFASYDMGNIAGSKTLNGRKYSVPIPQAYPRKTWEQLTEGERQNWENVAVNSTRSYYQSFADRLIS